MAESANPNALSDADYASAVFEQGGSLVVNLSGVAELKFELIPKGIYDANIDSVEYKLSKNSNAWMYEFIMEIEGGDYDKRKLYTYTSFSQKALRGTKTTLMRIDPVTFAGEFNPKAVAESGQLLGKKVRIKIGHDEYNGEQVSRISQVLPAAGTDAAAGGATGGGFFTA